MDEHADLPAVGFLEERPIDRIGERAPADVREHHDALHVELVHGPLQLAGGRIRVVHRDRREPEESPAVFLRELGVRVVSQSRDVRLRLPLDEVHIRSREREDLRVDADPVHVLEAFCHVGHRRGHAEEARAFVPDDPLAGRACAEREIAAASLDALEIRRRVVMRVKIEPHGGSLAEPRV